MVYGIVHEPFVFKFSFQLAVIDTTSRMRVIIIIMLKVYPTVR